MASALPGTIVTQVSAKDPFLAHLMLEQVSKHRRIRAELKPPWEGGPLDADSGGESEGDGEGEGEGGGGKGGVRADGSGSASVYGHSQEEDREAKRRTVAMSAFGLGV